MKKQPLSYQSKNRYFWVIILGLALVLLLVVANTYQLKQSNEQLAESNRQLGKIVEQNTKQAEENAKLIEKFGEFNETGFGQLTRYIRCLGEVVASGGQLALKDPGNFDKCEVIAQQRYAASVQPQGLPSGQGNQEPTKPQQNPPPTPTPPCQTQVLGICLQR